jgi:hypothetical protein
MSRGVTRAGVAGLVAVGLMAPGPLVIGGFPGMSAVARLLLGGLAGLALAAVGLLIWMADRVRRRRSFGPWAGAALRVLAPVVAGPGGWFLVGPTVSILWPEVLIGSQRVAVLSMGTTIGLAVHLAWVHRDWTPRVRWGGLAAAWAGSLLGAWLGFHAVDGLPGVLSTMVGAAVAANLAVVVVDVARDAQPVAAGDVPRPRGAFGPGTWVHHPYDAIS